MKLKQKLFCYVKCLLIKINIKKFFFPSSAYADDDYNYNKPEVAVKRSCSFLFLHYMVTFVHGTVI